MEKTLLAQVGVLGPRDMQAPSTSQATPEAPEAAHKPEERMFGMFGIIAGTRGHRRVFLFTPGLAGGEFCLEAFVAWTAGRTWGSGTLVSQILHSAK
jgi:hypothetical protein